MARYVVNVKQKIDNHTYIDTQVSVDLKTAKALAQVFVDDNRAASHLKQVPVKWYRTHSDRIIRWVGLIDDRLAVYIESI